MDSVLLVDMQVVTLFGNFISETNPDLLNRQHGEHFFKRLVGQGQVCNSVCAQKSHSSLFSSTS